MKKELSQRQSVAAQQEARLAQLEDALRGQFVVWRTAQRAQLNMQLLHFLGSHCERLRRERQAQQERVREARQAVEQKRQEVLRAAQEREVLVRLREKQRMQFVEEQARREQKVMDELATQRYVRGGETW